MRLLVIILLLFLFLASLEHVAQKEPESPSLPAPPAARATAPFLWALSPEEALEGHQVGIAVFASFVPNELFAFDEAITSRYGWLYVPPADKPAWEAAAGQAIPSRSVLFFTKDEDGKLIVFSVKDQTVHPFTSLSELLQEDI